MKQLSTSLETKFESLWTQLDKHALRLDWTQINISNYKTHEIGIKGHKKKDIKEKWVTFED